MASNYFHTSLAGNEYKLSGKIEVPMEGNPTTGGWIVLSEDLKPEAGLRTNRLWGDSVLYP